MTREEAIAILEDEAYVLYEDDSPYNRQAFDMAVEALKFRDAYEIAVQAANKAFENRWTQWVEWIPCRERLPENDDWVIVSIRDECGDTPYEYTDSGWYLDKGKCWIVEAEERNDVIAWMPLPTPFFDPTPKEGETK